MAEYTVKTGDTLHSIAEKLLGSADRWNEIFEANKDLIGVHPNELSPGTTLVIPDKEESV